MRKLFCLFGIFAISLCASAAGEWLFYKEYPWVYDHKTKNWLYLQGAGDGKIYAYRNSTNEWEEFTGDESTVTPSGTHTAQLNNGVSLEMIWVEAGTFTMGQVGVAVPEHNITLTKGFYLGKYEVTQVQYEAVMTGNSDVLSATPSQWPNNPNRPVEKVSWDDVQVFLTL